MKPYIMSYDDYKKTTTNVCDGCGKTIPQNEHVNIFLSDKKQYCEDCRKRLKPDTHEY